LKDETSREKRFKKSVIYTVIFGVFTLLVVLAAILYVNRLLDYFAAQNFQPTANVAAVKDKLQLTSRGHDLFYASQPAIQQQKELNSNCRSTERTAAILGCYYKRQIFLYDVTNPELSGALEVTAAHEMLHAAYDRLNFLEKQKVDSLIERQYEKVKDDAEIAKLMDYYEKYEPGAETNELHSIIGTTLADLDPELETYYAQYFLDRQSIVEMNRRYSDVFKRLNDEAERLTKLMSELKISIDADMARYETSTKQLEYDIESFNQRVGSGGFYSQGEFYASRQALIARINQLNTEQRSINEDVDSYNNYVKQLNKLSVKVNELNSSINGVTAPEVNI
jgi:hypothetical protein